MKLKKMIFKLLEFLIHKYFIFFLKCFIYLKVNQNKSKQNINQNSIAVINTFDQAGGAANLAFALTDKIVSIFEVKYFVKFKNSEKPWIEKIMNFNSTLFSDLLVKEAKKSGWIEFNGFDALNLLKNKFYQKVKVVHLHNLHGDFFSPALFPYLFKNKKTIWTIHDEGFITGHCSCTLGCERWKIGCGNCPDLTIYPPVLKDNTKEVLKMKKKWINQMNPTIITPSFWLEQRVRIAYPALKNIKTIPNGIDTTIFYPKNKLASKKALNFPLDKKLILFVAEFSTNNPFKGGTILREIIQQNTNKNLIFITVGEKNESSFENHVTFPFISNRVELANLYNACDVLLYPTQADNLPLVVLESMACGTPVIASRLGGIPEIISDHEDGFLINDYKNEKEFIEVLNNYINLTKEQQGNIEINATKKINNYFSLDKMVANYLKLYKEVSA